METGGGSQNLAFLGERSNSDLCRPGSSSKGPFNRADQRRRESPKCLGLWHAGQCRLLGTDWCRSQKLICIMPAHLTDGTHSILPYSGLWVSEIKMKKLIMGDTSTQIMPISVKSLWHEKTLFIYL